MACSRRFRTGRVPNRRSISAAAGPLSPMTASPASADIIAPSFPRGRDRRSDACPGPGFASGADFDDCRRFALHPGDRRPADGLRRPLFLGRLIRRPFSPLSSSSRFTNGIVGEDKQGIETPWVFSPERSTTPPFSCAGPMWSRRSLRVGSAFALLKLDLAMKPRAQDPTPQTLFPQRRRRLQADPGR